METQELNKNPCITMKMAGQVSEIQFIDDKGTIDVVSLNTFKSARYVPSHGILILNFGTTNAALVGHGLNHLVKLLLIDRKIVSLHSFWEHDKYLDFDIWIRIHSVQNLAMDEQIEEIIKYMDEEDL